MMQHNILDFVVMSFLDTINAHKILLLNKQFNKLHIWHLDCSNNDLVNNFYNNNNIRKLNDADLQKERYINLISLKCFNNQLITDKSISFLKNLRLLFCPSCNKITDESIIKLEKLCNLNCNCCDNITDISLSKLIKLNILHCSYCNNITQNSLQKLPNLEFIKCFKCKYLPDCNIMP